MRTIPAFSRALAYPRIEQTIPEREHSDTSPFDSAQVHGVGNRRIAQRRIGRLSRSANLLFVNSEYDDISDRFDRVRFKIRQRVEMYLSVCNMNERSSKESNSMPFPHLIEQELEICSAPGRCFLLVVRQALSVERR